MRSCPCSLRCTRTNPLLFSIHSSASSSSVSHLNVIHVTFTFFFFRLTNFFNFVLQILSAYFVVLPLRDEGAISLGLSNLPELFIGSLLLTVIATPFTSLVFSLPNLSKNKVQFYFITFLYSFNSIFIIHINCATPIIIWENLRKWKLKLEVIGLNMY